MHVSLIIEITNGVDNFRFYWLRNLPVPLVIGYRNDKSLAVVKREVTTFDEFYAAALEIAKTEVMANA